MLLGASEYLKQFDCSSSVRIVSVLGHFLGRELNQCTFIHFDFILKLIETDVLVRFEIWLIGPLH